MDTLRRDWKTSKIVLWKRKDDEFSCVDGQQRLRTVFSFMEDGLRFSENPKSDFSGRKFKELDPDERKKIGDYTFDIDIISEASKNDVADYFIRLQAGVPLNPAEKLNAILGDVRDFVYEVCGHDFFTTTIPRKDHRFSNRYLSAQIVLLAKCGAHNLKSKDLKEMYEGSLPDGIRETVKKKLDYLAATFGRKNKSISNRATVRSLFYFVLKEFENLSLAGKGSTLKRFLIEFQREIRRQRKLKEEDKDSELQTWQYNVVQAADIVTAIEQMHRVILKRFLKFEKEGKI
jgi:hypothetical protein